MNHIDRDYLKETLLEFLQIHSPTGYTDPIVRILCNKLDELELNYEITRRGAVRATILGESHKADRAIVAHLDTLGAMVKELKPNGRLAVTSVGTWSARFAEGARVSVFTDDSIFRGTILPLKASGHTFDKGVDSQPSDWDNLEIRVDAPMESKKDLIEAGFNIGDFVGVDSGAEVAGNDYINARHLDDKAGVAALLTAAKAITEAGAVPPVDCHLLFTITEEVGSGASAILDGDIAEMVSIDNGTCAPGQNSHPTGVTVAMADSTGPFDYHLTHHLLHICRQNEIPHSRDIFRFYHCDSASAVAAGNDIRTGLLAFGLDASHGYERCHIHSLDALSCAIFHYMLSAPVYAKQTGLHNTLKDFPKTRMVEVATRPLDEPWPILQTHPEDDPDEKKESED
ncbi:MAG: osmoprotectant NAGGN system M42 family peptidase [Opitutales bacterium]|nr:osmoprotectant NAGGN system M42 family peptidase [Opitutales bacterium]